MTTDDNWPTRQEWEADQRSRAEQTIAAGGNHQDYTEQPTPYTQAQDDEIDSLKPGAIKAIRRACGQIERKLRQQFPEADAVIRSFDYQARDALSPAARDAWEDLYNLSKVRRNLRVGTIWATDYFMAWDYNWPPRHAKPTSPEIERLHQIPGELRQMHRDQSVERARELLVQLDSGQAWADYAAARASREEWLRGIGA
jgi:hypothetical protein